MSGCESPEARSKLRAPGVGPAHGPVRAVQGTRIAPDLRQGPRHRRRPRAPVETTTDPSGRHNLPAELSSLVGRERDLHELQQILTSTRLITLTGPGGVGKTRLALRLGSMTGAAFRDGVWLIELAGVVDYQLVTETAATALGVRAAGAHTLEQALVRALQATRMLLILDNCEHVLAACAVLVSNLLRGCPHLHVLATSRETLSVGGEVAWRVGPLTLPPPAPTLDEAHAAPAVQLFAQRAHAAAPGFQLTTDNATSVSEVCRRLDGLPLAIELAAAAVPSLAISQLAARLATQLNLLSAGPSAPARQQTLGATLTWSYNLLTQPEQLLLRRTAVFAGGWSLEAVEAVCSDASLSRDQVVQSLTRLVARSLVAAEVDPDGELRYRLLEIVRTFALERLQRSGEAADVQARHFAFFADNAQRVEPHLHTADPAEFANQLERDVDNMRAALDWSLSGAAPDAGLRLATALRYFWFMRGHYREGSDRLRSALTVAVAAEPRLRAPALCSLGFMLVVQGQHAEARVHLESGLELGRLLADDQIIAFAYRYLGLIANAEARYGDAHDYLEHSLERYRGHGSPDDVALTLMYLGDACLYQNDIRACSAIVRGKQRDTRAAPEQDRAAISAPPTRSGRASARRPAAGRGVLPAESRVQPRGGRAAGHRRVAGGPRARRAGARPRTYSGPAPGQD